MSSTALAEIVPTMTAVEKARFWAKVDKNGPTMPHMSTPCWEWTGTKSLTVSKDREWRYGRVHIRNHRCMAHILSQWMAGAVVPAGAVVCHHCDNPGCVRPDHAYVGTYATNARDREDRWPAGKPHPAAGHGPRQRRGPQLKPARPNRSNARLTEEDVREVVRLRRSGVLLVDVAARFHVRKSAISSIMTGRNWNEVTGFARPAAGQARSARSPVRVPSITD